MNLLSNTDIEAAYQATGEDLYEAIRLLARRLRVHSKPDICFRNGKHSPRNMALYIKREDLVFFYFLCRAMMRFFFFYSYFNMTEYFNTLIL